MAYLISEVGDNAEILDSFDDIISQSYETFFNELESLYKEANRNDDNYSSISSMFSNPLTVRALDKISLSSSTCLL